MQRQNRRATFLAGPAFLALAFRKSLFHLVRPFFARQLRLMKPTLASSASEPSKLPSLASARLRLPVPALLAMGPANGSIVCHGSQLSIGVHLV